MLFRSELFDSPACGIVIGFVGTIDVKIDKGTGFLNTAHLLEQASHPFVLYKGRASVVHSRTQADALMLLDLRRKREERVIEAVIAIVAAEVKVKTDFIIVAEPIVAAGETRSHIVAAVDTYAAVHLVVAVCGRVYDFEGNRPFISYPSVNNVVVGTCAA